MNLWVLKRIIQRLAENEWKCPTLSISYTVGGQKPRQAFIDWAWN